MDMGFAVNSMGDIPISSNIKLFFFIVGPSWDEDLVSKLKKNFLKIADQIGPQAAIVIGTREELFADEVIKRYLGKSYHEMLRFLPALLITDAHPDELTDESLRLLVPLGEVARLFGPFDTFLTELVYFAKHQHRDFLEHFAEWKGSLARFMEYIEINPGIFGIGFNLGRLIRDTARA